MTPRAVRQLRDSLEMTQQAFADALGVSRRAVLWWERGRNGRRVRPHPVFVERMKELKNGTRR